MRFALGPTGHWGVAQLAERPAVYREGAGSNPAAPALRREIRTLHRPGPEGTSLLSVAASGECRVEEYTGTPAEWDRLVSTFPGGSHCHLYGWREVMEGALGHECFYLSAIDEADQVVALLPLGRVKSRVFGDYLVSMPFLNGGGAIGSLEGCRSLEVHARELATRLDVELLELRSRRASADSGLTLCARKITVELSLPGDLQVLWKGFHQKLRANINKAKKAGMEMRYGADQVAPFYKAFAHNMRDLGTPVLPLRFFQAIARTLPEHVVFGALWAGNRPVAGQCAFVFGDTLEMVWGSSVREYNRLKVTSHIHWAFIERASRAGCRTFDFGRCTEGSGTHQFKQQWGGVDTPLPWGQFSPSGRDSTPSPDRPLYRAAVSVWKRLPLAVTNRIGPLLARSLP